MRKAIADVINEVAKAPSDDAKVAILRANDHIGLRIWLQIMFEDSIVWLLPPGDPPFNPNQFLDQEGNFYAEIKRLYLFMEGGNPDLSQKRREELFIGVLESITPQDARLLLDVKDRKRPEGITAAIVNTAFPGLLRQQ